LVTREHGKQLFLELFPVTSGDHGHFDETKKVMK
jgi:hypothetical protein